MDSVNMLIEPLRVFLAELGTFLPRLALALVVLAAGWLLAKAVRFALEKTLRAFNFGVLTRRSGMDEFLQQGGTSSDTTNLFGLLAFWLVMLAALIIAFNGMGLTYITDLLGRVVLFVPKLIVGLLILTLGAYFARFMGGAVVTYCKNFDIRDAELLGGLAHYAILGFVILITLDQINVGGDIVRESFLIVLGGVVLAFALAFGLGGKDWAAAMLQRWWPTDRKDNNS